MSMEKFLNSSNLDVLFQNKYQSFENLIRKRYYINEEKKAAEDEEKLTSIINDFIKDEEKNKIVSDAVNEFELSIMDKCKFWNKLYYKYGYVDANNTKNEIKDFERTKLFKDGEKGYTDDILQKMEDEEFIENMSNFIEGKFEKLNQIQIFKEKDKKLTDITENFETTLTDEQNDVFDDIMRLIYQTEDYYFVLAYLLLQFTAK